MAASASLWERVKVGGAGGRRNYCERRNGSDGTYAVQESALDLLLMTVGMDLSHGSQQINTLYLECLLELVLVPADVQPVVAGAIL
jgi:hypothetical protein